MHEVGRFGAFVPGASRLHELLHSWRTPLRHWLTLRILRRWKTWRCCSPMSWRLRKCWPPWPGPSPIA